MTYQRAASVPYPDAVALSLRGRPWKDLRHVDSGPRTLAPAAAGNAGSSQEMVNMREQDVIVVAPSPKLADTTAVLLQGAHRGWKP